MKDLLVIYPMAHHTPLIKGQCDCLKKQGIYADSLLIKKEGDRIVFHKYCQGSPSFIFYICVFFYNHFNKVRGFTRLGLRRKLTNLSFNYIIQKYRIIEFGGLYNPTLLDYARRVKVEKKSVVVRAWDHYFADWQKELFMLSDVINVGNEYMRKDFCSIFPQFSEKLVTVPYGNDQIEVLNDLLEGKIEKDISFLDNNAQEKIVITIGYSGRAWHQHFYMIDAIEKLPNETKKKLFILIPMTYSNSDKFYNGYLWERLKKTGISFQILKKQLTIIQNMSMRIISDVVLNCQVNDALSSSIKEHLMAGSILIAGDWLPYKLFRNYGAYLHDTSMENFTSKLYSILVNLNTEKENCKKNRKIIYEFSSWKFKGEEYKNMYFNLINKNNNNVWD